MTAEIKHFSFLWDQGTKNKKNMSYKTGKHQKSKGASKTDCNKSFKFEFRSNALDPVQNDKNNTIIVITPKNVW